MMGPLIKVVPSTNNESSKRTEHSQDVPHHHCNIVVFDYQGEVTHVYDVVSLYEFIMRLVVDVVEMKVDIRRKLPFIRNLVQTDVQTVQLGRLRILACKVQQPDSHKRSSAATGSKVKCIFTLPGPRSYVSDFELSLGHRYRWM